MRRTTKWGLGLGVGVPALAIALGSLQLRLQSARLRSAVEQDGSRPVPQPALRIDRSTGRGTPLTESRADEDLPAVAVLGDSWVAGLDVGSRRRTQGMLVARGVARLVGEDVRLRVVAAPSAGADDLLGQVSTVLADRRMRRSRTGAGEPRYAVVSMGTADLVHPISGTIGLPVLSTVINRLQREGGYRVIVLTVPNLGLLPSIGRPLRDVLRRSSRVLSGSQWLTAVSTGALPVSLNQTLAGTTRIGLVSSGGRYPSLLGCAQLAAAIVRRIAEDLAAPVAIAPGTEPTEHPAEGPADDLAEHLTEGPAAEPIPAPGADPAPAAGDPAPASAAANPEESSA